MSEDAPTREELDELRKRLRRLEQAREEKREADTPAEKREAEQDVREAQSDIDEYLRRHGLTRADLAEAATVKRRRVLREDLEAIRAEEEEPSEDEDEDEDEAGVREPRRPKPKGPKAPPAAKRRPQGSQEEPPESQHWYERRIGRAAGD